MRVNIGDTKVNKVYEVSDTTGNIETFTTNEEAIQLAKEVAQLDPEGVTFVDISVREDGDWDIKDDIEVKADPLKSSS